MPTQRYKSGAIAAVPPVAGSPSSGSPTEAAPATVIGAWAFHALFESINRAIVEGGLAVDDTLGQLRDAIVAIAEREATAVGDGIVGGAPGTLDMLNEIAAALNNDPNLADTLTALINTRLTQGQADLRYVRLLNAFTAAQADLRYARIADARVIRLSVDRPADVNRISSGVTTTLGTLQLTRTGFWAVALRGRVADGSPHISFDGTEAGDYSRIDNNEVISIVRFFYRNNGASVVATSFQQVGDHRFDDLTFEALYIGPSA